MQDSHIKHRSHQNLSLLLPTFSLPGRQEGIQSRCGHQGPTVVQCWSLVFESKPRVGVSYVLSMSAWFRLGALVFIHLLKTLYSQWFVDT